VAAACILPHRCLASTEQSTILQQARLIGEVRDEASGKPVPGALLDLDLPSGKLLISTRSDAEGSFGFTAPAGRYRLAVSANGYLEASLDVTAAPAQQTGVRIDLTRNGALREIGHLTARASSSVTAESGQTLPAANLAAQGAVRVADALKSLPGVVVSGDALSPGGDAYVSLRGLRPAESDVLLDGHPVGPIGVLPGKPDADGTIQGFNFQDAPLFAVREVNVAFGTASSASAGSDAVGGSVDLRTIEPTAGSQFAVEQSLGSQGRSSTALRATGTDARLSYALVSGVQGTYGEFPGGLVAQTGLRGTDFTSSTLRQLTYHVSGDYVLRNQFAKVAYVASPVTKLTLSAYDATSWADKTGEGDNDFNPYAYVLANAPVGNSAACPHGVLVTENAGPACLSPSAYAAAASGPAGGGPGAWQALRNQDYDGRITSVAGRGALTLDVFADEYAEVYHRDASLVNGPLDDFLEQWSTQGFRATDFIGSANNTLGFGLTWLHQALTGNGTVTGSGAFAGNTPAGRIDRSVFVRDGLAVSPTFTLVGEAWLRNSSIDPVTHVDPQASLLYRPGPSDAFRLSAGATSDEPSLQNDRVNLLPIGALNPNCGALANATPANPEPVSVGAGPSNSALAAETGSDLEFGYEHRFDAMDAVNLTLYDANIANRITTGQFAAGTDLPASTVPALLTRIKDFCGLSPAPGAVTFTLARSFNAASARLRGIELTGRTRATAHLAVHYAYDVQSIVLDGLPVNALRTDPTLVNGVQAFEVPLQKATLGIEFSTPAGLLLRLDGHAVGPNNPQQLPGYAYADASLEQRVSRHLVLALDGANIFNSHAQSYGLVGYGLPYATNAYNGQNASPFLQTFNERYGLLPASLTLSAKLTI